MSKRRSFTAEQKVAIVREHLVNQTPISTLSERYDVHPNMIRTWQKQLFEGALETFAPRRGRSSKTSKSEQAKTQRLQERLQQREELISDLLVDNIRLKKDLSGEL